MGKLKHLFVTFFNDIWQIMSHFLCEKCDEKVTIEAKYSKNCQKECVTFCQKNVSKLMHFFVTFFNCIWQGMSQFLWKYVRKMSNFNVPRNSRCQTSRKIALLSSAVSTVWLIFFRKKTPLTSPQPLYYI
jgi:hypothetical protein